MTRYLLILSILTLIALPVGAVEFDHEAHNGYLDEPDCTTCHVDGAFSIVPEKSVCLDCHEKEFADDVTYPMLKSHGPLWSFNHRLDAKSGGDCESCHAQDFCLECHQSGFADEMGDVGNNMANVHRSEFQVSHPIAARTDQQLCSRCHENKFCVECHEQFAPADLAIESHRRGWSDIMVTGSSHEDFKNLGIACTSCHTDSVLQSHEWSASHAREARKNLATCQACHPDGDVCLTCHSAMSGSLGINPHPEDWGDMSENLKNASDGKSCRRCHPFQ
ncbi:MAG: cytochrome C [Desulfuromonas sp.]|nr:MAG: cytochrome C [Desulfuromonas sp.]